MWGVEQIVSAAIVLAVFIWLLVSIARNPSAMYRVPRRDAAVREEVNQAVRAAAERAASVASARTPTPPKRPLGVRVWEVTSTLFVLSLMLVAVVGVIWAAFAFHPGLGIAAVAIALLLMVASG